MTKFEKTERIVSNLMILAYFFYFLFQTQNRLTKMEMENVSFEKRYTQISNFIDVEHFLIS